MPISQSMAKFLIGKWLDRCVCENRGHNIDDARSKPAFLFIRPAINDKLKSDLSYLQELAGASTSAEAFQKSLSNLIVWSKDKYNYEPVSPFMCKECIDKVGLEINLDWRVAFEPPKRCAKCGQVWDSWDSQAPGAVAHDENGAPLCLVCFLRSREKKHADIRTNLTKSSNDRQKRDNLRRAGNDEILEEYLSQHACSECGENQPSQLIVVPGPKSPGGKPWQWRRDDSNDTFKKKLKTAQVLCKTCNGDNT